MAPLVRPGDGTTPDRARMTRRQRWTPSPRGWALLALGLAGVVRGYSYLIIPPTEVYPALMLVREYAPYSVIGTVWVLFGLGCLISLMLRRWTVAFSISAGLHFAWAVAFIAASIFMPGDHIWVSAINYALVAILSCTSVAMVDPPPRKELMP